LTTPFLQHHLFEINDNLKPQLNQLGPYQYLSIDNFYKRPEEIYEMLKNSWAEGFKASPSNKNFKEYFDCRIKIPLIKNGFSEEFKTISYLKSILSPILDNLYCDYINTNIFSWINTPSNNIQFIPHQDESVNILVYLDKINSGGTALYEKMTQASFGDIDIRYSLLTENIKHYVIPSMFNRCVIFNGNIPHGGYIEEHGKYSNGNWRYNAVYFFNKK